MWYNDYKHYKCDTFLANKQYAVLMILCRTICVLGVIKLCTDIVAQADSRDFQGTGTDLF